ncbi:hypothetical protein BCUN_1838 [Bifidobacterium cuniculi]|uniref:Uncharacterized protein n=2 Tax=Bifidobacterium cuniculi TaxID=1688 RepID=A0A087AT33_9BIFI|nr:hypothetical protein BCUN_1838 [Bifidobacterium cuniculi]
MMRLRGAFDEAARNIASGTTHAALYALLLAVVMVGCAGAELLQLRGIQRQIDEFVSAGASTYVVDAAGRIDARSCESLAGLDGVQAAGALRTADARLTLARIPSTALPTLEATPGALRALVSGDSATTRSLAADEFDGVWLSRQAADTSGAATGSLEALLDGGNVRIAGVYESPDDGRSGTTAYALVEPVPVEGTFDQCIVKAWPVPQSMESLALVSVGDVGTDPNDQPRVRQFNTKLGAELDATALFEHRATTVMTPLAAVGGLALGFVAIRLRRLELASALHCGVPKTALMLQSLMETCSWTVAALALCLPLLAFAWWDWPGFDAGQIVDLAARPLLAAACGALVGTAVAILAVRERNLFRYFKDRS